MKKKKSMVKKVVNIVPATVSLVLTGAKGVAKGTVGPVILVLDLI